MQVAKHADEDLLDEVFGALAVPDRTIDEVEEPGLITIHHRTERLRITGQVAEHQLAIFELVERLALKGAGTLDCRLHPLEDCCSHTDSRVAERNHGAHRYDILPTY